MNKEVIIKVRDLVKVYDDFTAISGISFDVHQGEIFGLLGPNGAGKTSTLEIMETLRTKTTGTIEIDGVQIEEDPQYIKSITGIQLQASGFFPGLNLVEMLQMFGGLYNVKVKPMELLTELGLQDKAKVKFDTLSGGQKQRFSIATTLVNKPKIIFLDEPTTGLDPQARRNLWDLIRDIQKKGTTVVITTHYLDEAEILCDRVAIMDHGKIISLDTPNNLIDQLVATGFTRKTEVKKANLEDVFINLTGKEMRGDE